MRGCVVVERADEAVALVIAGLAGWEKSLGSAWPSEEDDEQGAWIVGTVDEDGNRYPVITVEADQYDAPGDSERIARATVALWSQAFAARAAQTEQQSAGNDAPQCWWIDHGSHGQITQRQDEAESAVSEGKRVVRYTSTPITQTEPQPVEVMQFQYRHPDNCETYTVSLSRKEVADRMDDELFEKLTDTFCPCEPVGETNVVECRCDEYAEEFELLAAAPFAQTAPQTPLVARVAELEAELGQQHEAHRKTWRQLEQAQVELAALTAGGVSHGIR